MLNFVGVLKTMGVVLVVFVTIAFVIGFFNITNIAFTLTILYFICYVLNGFLSLVWNPETPYIASYLSSISLTVLNLLFAFFVLDILVFAEPVEVNQSLVKNSLISLIITYVVVKFKRRKEAQI